MAEHRLAGPGAGARVGRHRLRHGRHGLGRRGPVVRGRRVSRAWPICGRSPCPAAIGRFASRAGRRSALLFEIMPRARRRNRRPTGSRARELHTLLAMLAASASTSPRTSSMGRLFDAVAALCGLAAGDQLRGPGGDGPGVRRRRRITATPIRSRSAGDAPAVADWGPLRGRRAGRSSRRRAGRPDQRPVPQRPGRAGRGDRPPCRLQPGRAHRRLFSERLVDPAGPRRPCSRRVSTCTPTARFRPATAASPWGKPWSPASTTRG